MMCCDLNRDTEPRPRATLLVTAPQQAEDKVVHFGAYRECTRGLLSKRPVVLCGDRYSPADVVEFRNGSDEFLDWA
jgi:hypothetical protein